MSALLNAPGAGIIFRDLDDHRYIALEVPMHRHDHPHFRRLPPEARRATLWRLAWNGLTPEQIAQRTGLSAEEVRNAMHEELEPAPPRWTGRMESFGARA